MKELLERIKKTGSTDIPKVVIATGCSSQGNCQRCSK